MNMYFCLQYFVLIAVIFILEIVGGVLAFIYGNEIEATVGDELLLGINARYGVSKSSNGEKLDPHKDEYGLKTIWSYTQSSVSS